MQIYYRKLELIEDSIKKLSEIKKDNPDIEAYANRGKTGMLQKEIFRRR